MIPIRFLRIWLLTDPCGIFQLDRRVIYAHSRLAIVILPILTLDSPASRAHHLLIHCNHVLIAPPLCRQAERMTELVFLLVLAARRSVRVRLAAAIFILRIELVGVAFAGPEVRRRHACHFLDTAFEERDDDGRVGDDDGGEGFADGPGAGFRHFVFASLRES